MLFHRLVTAAASVHAAEQRQATHRIQRILFKQQRQAKKWRHASRICGHSALDITFCDLHAMAHVHLCNRTQAMAIRSQKGERPGPQQPAWHSCCLYHAVIEGQLISQAQLMSFHIECQQVQKGRLSTLFTLFRQ